MKLKINFKSKLLWVIIIIVIVLIIVFIPKGSKAPSYETVKVERGDIIQTVDTTGKIESSNDVALHFQMSGNISRVNVKEGEKVVAGKLLANLALSELDAAVAQAQASLNQKLAGSTDEQIDVVQKQVDSARVAFDKAESSLQDVVRLGDNNLKSKYSYASVLLDDSYLKLYNSFTSIKSIRDSYFNGSDQQGLKVQSVVDYRIDPAVKSAKSAIDKSKNGSYGDIDSAISDAITSMGKVYEALSEVRDICDTNNYKTMIPDSVRTTIDSQKSTIGTGKTAVVGTQNEIFVLKSQNESNKNSAEAAVESAKAALSIQEANLKSIIATPRDVDVAYYEAVLSQAKANRAKALLFAPMNGVISKVNKLAGELVGPADAVIEIISPHYEIKVDIPETDVVKLKIDDEAQITFDALGNDVKFKGKVISIEPSSTEIQDVVYYKIKVNLEENDERVKPGMTTNVLINTEKKSGVLYVPYRAVLNDIKEGRKYVKVLNGGQTSEKDVILGTKGDGGFVEVLSGLSEGEEVVLKTNK
ncbi:efflux RND transporter periplasmic adaptor subunit [bacterium]|jgi:RND family efflux transporter MFP subunit|nr:efflux RND transporter periplasmic adaptor subunit [bacterium]